jgi:NAD(P)-dependent dehydrogenase (short-subunit alcohol dehydrogenase family)
MERMRVPTVLITGATSGIGAAAAAALAREGFEVFGSSRREPSEPPPNMHWLAMDVCDEESVAKGVTQVISAAGRIDALVCNAGFGIFGSIEEVSIEASMRQFDTNFHGVLRTLRCVVPHMREAREGRIALVGSLAGRAPIPFQAHYSASKAAVESLAGALHNELRSFGVHVSLIEPGDINTPFNAAMEWSEAEQSHYGDQIRSCEEVIRESLPKAPGPELIANAILKSLTARRPRFRYSAGPDSLLVPLGQRLLPDWLVLRMIRDHFKI